MLARVHMRDRQEDRERLEGEKNVCVLPRARTHTHTNTHTRSIVGHMEAKGMLGRRCVFVEMGAGRGTLSRTIREAAPMCDVILVERCRWLLLCSCVCVCVCVCM